MAPKVIADLLYDNLDAATIDWLLTASNNEFREIQQQLNARVHAAINLVQIELLCEWVGRHSSKAGDRLFVVRWLALSLSARGIAIPTRAQE